jgi:hypothetical protein
MPIPAVKATLDPQQPDSRPMPPQRVHWQHTYVSITGSDGQGEEIPLSGITGTDWPVVFLLAGATGLDMPPMELHADASPNLDGSIYRGARAAQRDIMLPVFIWGVDRKSLLDTKRSLISALNPKNGACVLKFVESDGQPRYLRAYYKAGMEGDESADNAGFRWMKLGLQLTAFDLWFYADTLHVAQWRFGEADPFLTPAFLPFALSEGLPSTTQLPVVNPGDIEAWPVWQITGPVLSLRFTGPDGAAFALGPSSSGGAVIPADRVLTVDTRPGYKTLTDDEGMNYYPLLAAGPQLWSVPPGTSMTTLTVVIGSGQASVRMTLTPRYESY